jgi:hypothetical protein
MLVIAAGREQPYQEQMENTTALIALESAGGKARLRQD